MAITYIVGIPRSGKTYYAMYQLWKFFVRKIKDTKLTRFIAKISPPKPLHNYDLAYTNINQFDFTKSDKIKKLDFDDLKAGLIELYTMYMDKKTDDELLEVAKKLKLNNVLIVIDEVHNFLGTKVDDVLKWWLTYHGHLHQDLFFITQDLSLVATQYKSNAEFFYRAIPPSARLSTKKFRYTQYRNSRMANNGKIADFTLPAVQEIFDMYVSGAENKSKSIIHKFLKIAMFFALFLPIAIYFFINSFETSTSKESKENVIENKQVSSSEVLPNKRGVNNIQKNVPASEDNENNPKRDLKNKKRLFEINCYGSICTYKNADFPLLLFLNIVKENKDSFFYIDKNGVNGFKKYFLLAKEDTFNFLDFGEKKDDKNKRKNKTNSSNAFNFLHSTSK